MFNREANVACALCVFCFGFCDTDQLPSQPRSMRHGTSAHGRAFGREDIKTNLSCCSASYPAPQVRLGNPYLTLHARVSNVIWTSWVDLVSVLRGFFQSFPSPLPVPTLSPTKGAQTSVVQAGKPRSTIPGRRSNASRSAGKTIVSQIG